LNARGEHHIDVTAKSETEIFDCRSIERIDQRHTNGVVRFADRQGAVQTGQTGWDETQDLRGKLHLIEIDDLGSKRVGDRLVKLRFVHDSVVDHRLVDCFAILRGLEQNVVGLGAVHQAVVDEEICESFVVHNGKNDE